MSIYKPADFASTTPPPRIMGTEMEYMLRVDEEDYTPAAMVVRAARRAFDTDDRIDFLPNGARVYPDVGNVEYATPECLGPREQTLAELAGQFIVQRAVSDELGTKIPFYRRVGGPDTTGERSLGYHQNFLTLPYADKKEQEHDSQVLGAHLVSRVVWSGSGMVGSTYALSQKAHDVQKYDDNPELLKDYYDPQVLRIGHYGARTADKHKPLLAWSRSGEGLLESHSTGWERLEVRYADANHSPWGMFMSMATTSLVLRLLEHKQMLPDSVWDGLRIKHLADSTQQISKDISFQQTHELVSGEVLTAVDLQQRFARLAVALSCQIQLPKDEHYASQQWLTVCDDLSNYDPLSVGSLDTFTDRLEWAARLRTIYAKNMRNITSYKSDHVRQPCGPNFLINTDNELALGVDQIWDQIHPSSVAHNFWKRRQPEFYAKNSAAIEDFMVHPPRFTRAYTRGKAMRRGYIPSSGNWCSMIGAGGKIELPDPYDYGD